MKNSRFSEQQIIKILKSADAGMKVQDLCRQYGISDATNYKWKSKYGGLEAADIKRLREVEAENAKLKRRFADLALENRALKDLTEKSSEFQRASSLSSLSGQDPRAVRGSGLCGARHQSHCLVSNARTAPIITMMN
jgi:putative transposase